jgi:hypothetical protein
MVLTCAGNWNFARGTADKNVCPTLPEFLQIPLLSPLQKWNDLRRLCNNRRDSCEFRYGRFGERWGTAGVQVFGGAACEGHLVRWP